MRAIAWASPNAMPWPTVSWSSSPLLGAHAVGPVQDQREATSAMATIRRSRSVVSIRSWNSRPRTTIGMLPTMISQPMRASGSPFRRPASEREPGGDDPADVAAEVEEHRGLGADLGDRGERRAGVVPAEGLADDPQVGAGGDRQELGQPLDDARGRRLRTSPCQRLPARRSGTRSGTAGRAGTEGHSRGRTWRPAAPPRRSGLPGDRRPPPVGWPVVEQRALGRSGLVVSRLALGTMTWGRDTDEDEAAMQLDGLRRRGRHAGRHRRRLLRRRERAHPRPPARPTSSPAPTCSSPPRPSAGPAPGPMGRGASRGHLLAALDASLSGSAWTTSTCGSCTPGTRRTPLEETLAACDLAVSSGRARYVGHQQLHRLADRAGGHLAARLAGPHAADQHPGRVLAAAARRRARGGAGRRVARASGVLRLVAAGPRAAHRQVPAQHAVGVPRRLPAVAGVHRRAALGEVRPDRRGGDHRGRGPGHHPLAVALAWVRDRPGVVAPIVGARTAQQLQASLDADGVRLPAAIRTALEDVSAPPFSYPERRSER